VLDHEPVERALERTASARLDFPGALLRVDTGCDEVLPFARQLANLVQGQMPVGFLVWPSRLELANRTGSRWPTLLQVPVLDARGALVCPLPSRQNP
jgi:hypothetical protein